MSVEPLQRFAEDSDGLPNSTARVYPGKGMREDSAERMAHPDERPSQQILQGAYSSRHAQQGNGLPVDGRSQQRWHEQHSAHRREHQTVAAPDEVAYSRSAHHDAMQGPATRDPYPSARPQRSYPGKRSGSAEVAFGRGASEAAWVDEGAQRPGHSSVQGYPSRGSVRPEPNRQHAESSWQREGNICACHSIVQAL